MHGRDTYADYMNCRNCSVIVFTASRCGWGEQKVNFRGGVTIHNVIVKDVSGLKQTKICCRWPHTESKMCLHELTMF